MAGHSKWANIRHRKERMDSRRGKMFARFVKEAAVAARIGGTDPASNPRLRLAIEKARAANVPNDNLERAILRGGGRMEGADYTEMRYEGYGPGGAAVLVHCLTDNKNRASSDVRHAFSKHGGNLGADGSVSYLFARCGQLIYAPGTAEAAGEAAIERGASDLHIGEDGSMEVLCAPEDFPDFLAAMRADGYEPESADIVMRASSEVLLNETESARMRKMLLALEDLDDTQEVYTSAVLCGEDAS